MEELQLRSICGETVAALGEPLALAADLAIKTTVAHGASQPVVIAIGKIAGLRVRIADTPTRHDHLADIRMIATGAILQEQKVRRLGYDDTAVGEGEARGDVKMIGENRELVGLAVAVGIFADDDFVMPLLLVFHDAMGVIGGLGDPQTPTIIPGEGDGLHDVRLGGEKHQFHVGWNLRALHAALHGERFLESQWFRTFFVVRDIGIFFANLRLTLVEEFLPIRKTCGRQTCFQFFAKGFGGDTCL